MWRSSPWGSTGCLPVYVCVRLWETRLYYVGFGSFGLKVSFTSVSCSLILSPIRLFSLLIGWIISPAVTIEDSDTLWRGTMTTNYRNYTYLELIMESDLRARVSQLSVIPSISERNCNHCSLFCGPSNPGNTNKIYSHIMKSWSS